jgi:predicted  nucleic acid-binding Zn-ribbon protein
MEVLLICQLIMNRLEHLISEMKATLSAVQEEIQAISASQEQMATTIWAHQEKMEAGQEEMRPQ